VLERLRARWERAAYSGTAIERLFASLLPGVGVALFVIAFIALTQGRVSSGVAAIAALAFIVCSWSMWRGSVARRFDRRTAEQLARRDGWGEPIEFAGRPVGANVIFRGTIWIATDRRLVEASRPPLVAQTSASVAIADHRL
jgi:hypothetical protein